eukprot:4011561-Amphidinium_carterae.1
MLRREAHTQPTRMLSNNNLKLRGRTSLLGVCAATLWLRRTAQRNKEDAHPWSTTSREDRGKKVARSSRHKYVITQWMLLSAGRTSSKLFPCPRVPPSLP